MSYRTNVQVGHIVHIEITNREDQEKTTLVGQVTGVAESFLSPDISRLQIAGLETWIDLDNFTEIERMF